MRANWLTLTNRPGRGKGQTMDYLTRLEEAYRLLVEYKAKGADGLRTVAGILDQIEEGLKQAADFLDQKGPPRMGAIGMDATDGQLEALEEKCRTLTAPQAVGAGPMEWLALAQFLLEVVERIRKLRREKETDIREG